MNVVFFKSILYSYIFILIKIKFVVIAQLVYKSSFKL